MILALHPNAFRCRGTGRAETRLCPALGRRSRGSHGCHGFGTDGWWFDGTIRTGNIVRKQMGDGNGWIATSPNISQNWVHHGSSISQFKPILRRWPGLARSEVWPAWALTRPWGFVWYQQSWRYQLGGMQSTQSNNEDLSWFINIQRIHWDVSHPHWNDANVAKSISMTPTRMGATNSTVWSQQPEKSSSPNSIKFWCVWMRTSAGVSIASGQDSSAVAILRNGLFQSPELINLDSFIARNRTNAGMSKDLSPQIKHMCRAFVCDPIITVSFSPNGVPPPPVVYHHCSRTKLACHSILRLETNRDTANVVLVNMAMSQI